MVFLKLLGCVDLGMALMLGLTLVGVPPGRFYFFFALLHATKGVFFIRNFLSIIDVVIVGYTLILPFWNSVPITLFIIGFLGLKGAYSLL